jgi:hypothetical protein
MMPDRFRGWVPLRLYWQGGEPWIDWCRLGSIRFTDPFFEMTIARCMQDPFAMLFRKQTPLSDLCEWHAVRPGLRPSGFIFHMSRCGSTLISQMFAAVPRHVVISEGIPIDSILSLPAERATSEQRVEWLTSMVGALGQPRAGDESRYFIKFDAWHIRELPLIRKAFPGVPWIFLYRDPIEVLVSQVKKPGSWTLPGHLPPAALGLEFADLPRIPRDEYCARVLALILQAAVKAMEVPAGGGRLIHYRQLPGAVGTELDSHFRTGFEDAEIEMMQEAAHFDAKTQGLPFSADSETKRRSASPRLVRISEEWLSPWYERLESMWLSERGACG